MNKHNNDIPYRNYSYNNIINTKNKEDKEDEVDDFILRQIAPYLEDKENIEEPKSVIDKIEFFNVMNNTHYKKRKIKKMKNYNIRKGDWQCKYCYNINFNFRIKCNICGKEK